MQHQTGTYEDELDPVRLSHHLQATNFDTVGGKEEKLELFDMEIHTHLAQELQKLKDVSERSWRNLWVAAALHLQSEPQFNDRWATVMMDALNSLSEYKKECSCCFMLLSKSHIKYLMWAQANLKLCRDRNSPNFVVC